MPKQTQPRGSGSNAARLLKIARPHAPACGARVLLAFPDSTWLEPESAPVRPHTRSPHTASDVVKPVPPSSSPKMGTSRADTKPNLSELSTRRLQKGRRPRSVPHLSRDRHAEAGDVGGGNGSQLRKCRMNKGGIAGDSISSHGRWRLSARTQFCEPACSKQCHTIHACPRFEDFYQVISDVMPSVHKGMEIKRAVAWHSKEEVIVKVRWKESSFPADGAETAWRASTERMLNLPPCRSIARVQQVIETPKAYFVVMEKASGQDLYEHLQSEGCLPIEEVRDVLQQLLTAVGELHSRGCIHKDVKLENVMLDRAPSSFVGSWSPVPSRDVSPSSRTSSESGVIISPAAGLSIVKLIDFDTVEEWLPNSTKASEVLGTDQYIAPEAYEGSYSPASDIFAIGVLAYKLLSGSFPFPWSIFNDRPGENWVGSPKMQQIRDKLHNLRIDWWHPVFRANPAAQQILARMLAINEACRPSAREALADPWLAGALSESHSECML